MHSHIDKIIRWSKNLIKLRLETLKDDFLKNMKIVNLIRNHALIISLLIILLGILNIYILYSNIDKTKLNTIIINTEKATEGAIIYNENNSYIQANPSEDLPFFMQITISVEYKEPVMRESNMNLKRICISTKRSHVESFHPNLNVFDLYLYEPNAATFYYTNKGFNFANFKQKNLSNLISLTCYQYEDSLIFVEPDINGEYKLSYKLEYTDEENRTYRLNGKSDLEFPIKSASEVDAMNIRINKSILFLTAWLIILGSFPFSVSLKQLLEKNK